ncbi:hypothetical protein [Burkholderia paludis]|uniref:hypothetical protein n=1 Tax=Burkholderia paludis TaxID=1506587 RepID=UPI00126A6F26|nr:hypothetical protein [Burkholderia paludis]
MRFRFCGAAIQWAAKADEHLPKSMLSGLSAHRSRSWRIDVRMRGRNFEAAREHARQAFHCDAEAHVPPPAALVVRIAKRAHNVDAAVQGRFARSLLQIHNKQTIQSVCILRNAARASMMRFVIDVAIRRADAARHANDLVEIRSTPAANRLGDDRLQRRSPAASTQARFAFYC